MQHLFIKRNSLFYDECQIQFAEVFALQWDCNNYLTTYGSLQSGQTWISNYIRCNQDYVVLSCRNLYLILSDGLGGDLVLAGGEGGGCGWPLPPGDCVLEAGLGGTIVLGLGMGARGPVGSAVVAPVKKESSLTLYLMYTRGLPTNLTPWSNEVFSRNPWVFFLEF